MKGIVLCSGGLDSTLALLKLLKDGNTVTPMFIDYNQWSLEGEKRAGYEIVEWLGDQLLLGFDNIDGYNAPKRLGEAVEVKVKWSKEKVGSVWGRNVALVGLAAMWVYTHGNDYDFIALGNHKGDVGPDCKPGGFDYHLDAALHWSTKNKISLLLPISELTIEDIGKELAGFGRELFELTFSCYWYPPCGYKSTSESYRCPGCRRKVMAMKAAAGEDSGLYEYFQQRLFRLPNCKERTYQSPLAEKVGY